MSKKKKHDLKRIGFGVAKWHPLPAGVLVGLVMYFGKLSQRFLLHFVLTFGFRDGSAILEKDG